jgi:type I restriction enzyme S subunit
MMEAAVKVEVKRYPAYKDSGVEWLGHVPEHWELLKLSAVLTEITQRKPGDLPLLSITREKGVILRDTDNDEENHNFIPDDLSNYKVLKQGQFGMNKMKAWQGSYGISDFDGIVSPAYFIFNLNQRLLPRFFHLAIRSKVFVSMFGAASDGVRVGQWDLSKVRMRSIPIPIPPLSEQTAIASFLDRKCALIDKAIAIKEKQIALLKERRQILIQNAVTRGLNPNVKMKDSGVEWIGEIPEHWEVKRLKYILKERNERSLTGEEPLFMMSQIHGLVVRADFHEKAEVAKTAEGNKIVHKGDLVFNKLKAHLGVFFKSTIDISGIVSPDYAVYYSNGIIDDLKYLELLFRCPEYLEQFICRITGIVEGLMRLYTHDLFEIAIPVPPINEQKEILSLINSSEAKIANAISLKEHEIEKLKEYKTCLINEAVTGKIKVC